MPKKTEIDHYSDKEALDFHINGKSGKIEINSSKPLTCLLYTSDAADEE